MTNDQYGVFENERAIKIASIVFDRALRDIASLNPSIRTLSHERVLAVGSIVSRVVAAMPIPLKFDGKIKAFVLKLYDRLQADHAAGTVYKKYRRPDKRRRIALRVIGRLESIIGENF